VDATSEVGSSLSELSESSSALPPWVELLVYDTMIVLDPSLSSASAS